MTNCKKKRVMRWRLLHRNDTEKFVRVHMRAVCEAGQFALAVDMSRKAANGINTRDRYRQTLLHYAVMNAWAPMLDFCLSSRKLDAGAVTPLGYTALHFAASGLRSECYRSQILHLIEKCPWALQAREYRGLTPLLLAACECNQFMLRLLLQTGADPRETTEQGDSALHLIVATGSVRLVPWLVEEHGLDPNTRNDDLATPLTFAIQCLARAGALRKQAIATLLTTPGLDPNVPGANGQTPLQLAEELRLDDVRELLLSHGALPSGVKTEPEA